MLPDTLFKRDVFSPSKMVWSPVTNNDTLDYLRWLLETYYPAIFCKDTSFFYSGSIEINSKNFLFVSKIGEVVLKQLPKYDQRKINILETIDYTIASQVGMLPKCILNVDQQFSTNNGEFFFVVYNKIGIRHYSGTIAELEMFFEKFRLLENHTRTIPSGSLEIHKVFNEKSIEVFERFLRLESQWPTMFDERTVKALEKGMPFATEVVSFLKAHMFQEHLHKLGLYHIDLHPHNITINGNELFFVFIDSIQVCSMTRSLGFGLFKLIRQSLSNGWDMEPFRDFIQKEILEYVSLYGLTIDDLRLAAHSEVARRLCLVAKSVMDDGNYDWVFTLPMHLEGLKEINYIFKEVNNDSVPY